MTKILDEATLASIERNLGHFGLRGTHELLLIDNVRRLKEALDLATDWASRSPAGHSTPQYDTDMARIRELAGDE